MAASTAAMACSLMYKLPLRRRQRMRARARHPSSTSSRTVKVSSTSSLLRAVQAASWRAASGGSWMRGKLRVVVAGGEG